MYTAVYLLETLFTDIDIETFLTFKKISSLTKDVIQIRKALSHSDFFEVNVDMMYDLYVYFKIIWLWNACCINKNIIYLVKLFFVSIFKLNEDKTKVRRKTPIQELKDLDEKTVYVVSNTYIQVLMAQKNKFTPTPRKTD